MSLNTDLTTVSRVEPTDASHGDSLVLAAPPGRFDAHEAPGFQRLFESAVDAGSRSITIDLTKVVFMDSTALAELVRAQRLLHGVGGSMRLANPSDAVRVILEVTGLASVFSVIRTP
jgi:anti-sigma B factor antagonist